MLSLKIFNIFRKGSKTYFFSSLFFPREVRDDVFKLYAFVRVADNFVDKPLQDIKGFNQFTEQYKDYLKVDNVSCEEKESEVVKCFVELIKRKKIKKEWVDAFNASMLSDTRKLTYNNWKELSNYIHGSAEVIGLMMCSIMNLPKESWYYARKLGYAMQFANFIRDIDVDNFLGRRYIPDEDLKRFKLKNLKKNTVMKHKSNFEGLIDSVTDKYYQIQFEAEKGFKYIPKRYLIAIKTASDMYKWTIKEIKKNPYIVYEKQLKPKVSNIISAGLKNFLEIYLSSYRTKPKLK